MKIQAFMDLFGLTLNKWMKLPNCSCHETSGPETQLFYSVSYNYETFCLKTNTICLIEQSAFIDAITYVLLLLLSVIYTCTSQYVKIFETDSTDLILTVYGKQNVLSEFKVTVFHQETLQIYVFPLKFAIAMQK